MEYRQLGNSGLRVSTLTLGTMGYGGTGWATPVGTLDTNDARRQLDLAKDAGVNILDTADVYSNGLSEQILGDALAADRDDWIVATKVRMTMGDGPNEAGASRHHIIRGAEASLITAMGRYAAHTGQIVTREQALNWEHDLAPNVAELTMDSPAPLRLGTDGKYPVPQPGITTRREF